jgi:enoyl-CoA hydratase/carnithine racemase
MVAISPAPPPQWRWVLAFACLETILFLESPSKERLRHVAGSYRGIGVARARGLGGAHFRNLTRAGWGDAMYHLFPCDEFNAAQAHKIGFVQEVVAPGQQITRAMEIANLIAKNAPVGIQVTKEAALKYIEAGERAAIDYIPKIKDRVFSSEDMKEGVQSFVERRSAVFRGK